MTASRRFNKDATVSDVLESLPLASQLFEEQEKRKKEAAEAALARELRPIVNDILKASGRGKTEITVQGVTKSAEKELTRLGYVIKHFPPAGMGDVGGTVIRWGQKQ